MANLNNLSEMQNLDRDNILKNIQEFPEQCERCWKDWQKIALPTSFIQAKSVLFCGMGGSGIGGAIAAKLVQDAKIPLITWNDYGLPGFVNKDTLVIATSYSGNTEETISTLKAAAEKTQKIITISSGGKLASLASNFRVPAYKIDYGSEPRAALGYTLTSILAILSKLSIQKIADEEFREAILILRGLQKKIDVNIPENANNAKILARKLFGRLPVVYGAGVLAPIASRWKGEFNENAKTASYCEVIPELNHNSLVGLEFPANLRQKIFVVILQSKYDLSRNRLRENLTGQILVRSRIEHDFVLLEPSPSQLAEVFQMIHFGDYVSYYLAMLNNVEPNPVSIIKFLKEKLAEKPMDGVRSTK